MISVLFFYLPMYMQKVRPMGVSSQFFNEFYVIYIYVSCIMYIVYISFIFIVYTFIDYIFF